MVLHPPLAGTHLDTWVPLSKSPIVKPEWVLEKVTEVGRFQRTCQTGNRKKKEILILEQRRAGVIKGFKSPEGCREEKGDAGSVGLLGPRDGVGEAQNQEEAHSAQFRKLPCSKEPSPLALGHLLGNVHPGNRDTEPEASQVRGLVWRFVRTRLSVRSGSRPGCHLSAGCVGQEASLPGCRFCSNTMATVFICPDWED